MAERSGLLMDWGGVLTTDVFASFSAFCSAEGLDADTVRDAFATDPRARELLVEFECGRLPNAEFEHAFAPVLGLPHGEGLIGRLFGELTGNAPLLEAVAGFRRSGVKTGLLSNSWGAHTYPADTLAELFDVLVISGELGVRKPDASIYSIAVERMQMAPEQLVFVDDLPGNLKPARALGIHTILHRDTEQTLAELQAVLGD
ncbi:MAG: family hydrolase [Solirubrobacterales bacterium]|nr:family hydrolase [Solirubrobacterales bacterium]